MKLLVDANLSPRVAAILRSAGHDARHVTDVGLGTASDAEILAWTRPEQDAKYAAWMADRRGRHNLAPVKPRIAWHPTARL